MHLGGAMAIHTFSNQFDDSEFIADFVAKVED
jgi:hypothetical protein